MQTTPLGLKKPDLTDNADLTIFIGDNMDALDTLITNNTIAQQFTAIVQGVTWSRILNLNTSGILGHSFILNVSATRGSVVYNTTFLINASHSQTCNIVQLNNVSYSTIQIRGVVDTNGNGWIELYDSANAITSTTTQSVTVTYTQLKPSTMTPITSFTNGTTIPTGYAVKGQITSVIGADFVGSVALNGTPTAPTASAGTNTTQIATTAYVQTELSNDMATAIPKMDSTAAVGTGTRKAREDHVHPTDTSRAPLASPTFTGTPMAPTASTGDNSTQIATTAFVKAQSYAKGGMNISVGTTAPSSPVANDIWIDTN